MPLDTPEVCVVRLGSWNGEGLSCRLLPQRGLLLPIELVRNMTDVSFCDLGKTDTFCGKDVFLDLRAEVKQVNDLVQPEDVHACPSCDLFEIPGPAIGQHGRDLVGEEELFTDEGLIGEGDAGGIGQSCFQLVQRQFELVFLQIAIKFDPEFARVPVIFDSFHDFLQNFCLLL